MLAQFKHQSSPFPYVIINEDLRILEASDSTFSFFDDCEKEHMVMLEHLLGELPDAFKHAVSNKLKYSHTLRIICKKGKTRWIRAALFPLLDKTTKFQVHFDDLSTEYVRYEMAQQVERIAKIGSWSVDMIENKVSWSDTTKRIHEVALDFVPDLETGINFYKEGAHRNKISNAVNQCIQQGTSFDEELIIVTAKQNEKWVRAIGEAERNNGKTVGLKGVFQDINEIKRERIKTQIMDDRMRVAVQSANIGIWDWNVVDNTLIWDENMFVIFGVAPNKFEHAYEAWESALHPEDKEQAVYEVNLALHGKKDFDTEFRICKDDGSVAYIQGRAQVFRDDMGNPLRMIGINSDVSRIKRKDQRLHSLLELTEKQDRKLVNFAHIVSHNLRTNSANITMLADMLVAGLDQEQTGKFLGMIQQSAEKLEETLNHLNEIVKIQATDKSELVSLSISPVLEDVREALHTQLEASKANLSFSFPPHLEVWGIRPYLYNVFSNLLTNSIRFSNPKKKLQIKISSRTLSDQVILIFSDNGLGIDLDKYGKQLFGMYKTFHDHKDAKGIGLFIAKNQMEAMHGKIEVNSKVGEGTTFYLYFKSIL